MDELVAWIREQLDERERVANAATPGPWTDFGKRPYGVEQLGVPDGHMVAEIQACEDHEDRQAADAEHIALHDPASVLNDIAAKRKILDWAERWMPIAGMGGVLRGEVERLVKIMAEGYDKRPGYRKEWRP